MTDDYTLDDARKRNEALRRVARIDRAEINTLISDLREDANRNHFAERFADALASKPPRRHA